MENKIHNSNRKKRARFEDKNSEFFADESNLIQDIDKQIPYSDQEKVISQLREWLSTSNLPPDRLDQLLSILKIILPSLPTSSEVFLNEKSNFDHKTVNSNSDNCSGNFEEIIVKAEPFIPEIYDPLEERSTCINNEDSNDSTFTLKYAVVNFIKRGRKNSVKSIDIVPTNWLTYDKKTYRSKAPFIKDASQQQDVKILHSLVKNLHSAPDSWPLYTVNILDQAETYGEAKKKLEYLRNINTNPDLQNFSLTDVTKTFKNSATTPKNDLNDISAIIDNVCEKTIHSLEDNNKVNKLRLKNFSNLLSLDNEDNKNQIESLPVLLEANVDDIIAPPNSSDAYCVQIKPGFESVVLSELSIIKHFVNKNNKDLCDLKTFLLDKSITSSKTSTDTFSKKYNLQLPFKDNESFISFNHLIDSDALLKEDLLVELHYCLDKDLSITRSYAKMIRAFISKTLAVQYTASRKSTNKNIMGIFKHTSLYKCMKEILIPARRSKNMSCEDILIMSGLSDVLSNAKTWPE